MDAFLDIEVSVPKHKTRADIMTVGMAVKYNKSSKNHKLKPRSNKRDNSKTQEAKERAQSRHKALHSKQNKNV